MSVTAEMVEGYEEMRRSTVQYDYERVFWGSAYGIAIVGLGWVTIKLGRIIQNIQEAIGTPGNPLVTYQEYNFYVTYVERNPKLGIEWILKTGITWIKKDAQRIYDNIVLFRSNPEEWEDFKEEYRASKESEPPEARALDLIDGLYSRYGMVLPAGVLGFQLLSEAIRVRRLRDGG